ncbi:A24 family peptidase [Caballeronia sp. LjRoot31]|jgi:prepilin peptidase CpaA|uniref:A24 family peptidase n=1 Tax=Caballeronia sp. LjRoot31 TaxID=3342324 RepID=UPI003ECFE281
MINAALFISWALAVVLFDCRLRRIPNWLVIAGLAVACVLAASGHSPFHIDVSDAALGLLAGLLALSPFYLIGLMGAADVKVFATLGAWCGFHALPALWIVASIAAGVHALYLLASAVIEGRRQSAESSLESSPNTDGYVSRPRDVTGVERSSPYTFMVGGRRATPYAALLAVSAIGSLTLQVFEAAR